MKDFAKNSTTKYWCSVCSGVFPHSAPPSVCSSGSYWIWGKNRQKVVDHIEWGTASRLVSHTPPLLEVVPPPKTHSPKKKVVEHFQSKRKARQRLLCRWFRHLKLNNFLISPILWLKIPFNFLVLLGKDSCLPWNAVPVSLYFSGPGQELSKGSFNVFNKRYVIQVIVPENNCTR